MFTVEKVKGGFVVLNWAGEIEIAYRNRKHAENYALGAVHEIFNEAERYNERFDTVNQYLADRAKRVPLVDPQLSMF